MPPAPRLSPMQPHPYPGRWCYLGEARRPGKAAEALRGHRGVQADSHLPPPLLQLFLVPPISAVGSENVGPFCAMESEIPPTPTQRRLSGKVHLKSSERQRPRA